MAFTFFFRDNHTLEQAVKYLLPLVSGFKKVRIWDAGCAMGPEPFTFAILLAEKMGYFAFKNVVIDETDIDETDTFGNIINKGIYPEGDLARIPREIFEKYFHPAEQTGYYIIDDKIRNRVIFHKNDLLKLQPVGTGYNLIICKNVLLHFQPSERIQVFKMFHSVLGDNGLVVTEQTQPLPEECMHQFHKIANDANVFQKV